MGLATLTLMTTWSTVLAHQGGWDEILLVAGPLIVLWLLLVMANRRAKRLNEEAPDNS